MAPRTAVTLEHPPKANMSWSLDYMSDALRHGRRFRTANVIGDFNRSYRESVLDMYLFKTTGDVQRLTNSWLHHYNNERPHKSLGYQTPMQYKNNFF